MPTYSEIMQGRGCCERSDPRHSGRRALDRLMRLYVGHHRNVRQRHYTMVAARNALIGAWR
jgi:hypothetical protein